MGIRFADDETDEFDNEFDDGEKTSFHEDLKEEPDDD